MRTLEHRRHSRRDPSGVHLNAVGRALARRVGRSIGPFDRVVTSPRPRAVETAQRMGRTVDATVAALAEMPEEVIPFGADPPCTFEEYAELFRRSAAATEFGERQAALWRTELERVPDGGTLLAVSHGGIIELGTIAAVPALASAWGPALGYLEGVRLRWDGRSWVSGEVIRLSPSDRPDAQRSAPRTRRSTSSGVPVASTGRSNPALR